MSVLEREVLGQMTVPKDPSYTRGQMLPADSLCKGTVEVFERIKLRDVVLTEGDQPTAAVVSIERYEALRSLETRSESVEELRLMMHGLLAVMEAGPDAELTSFDELLTELGFTEDDLVD